MGPTQTRVLQVLDALTTATARDIAERSLVTPGPHVPYHSANSALRSLQQPAKARPAYVVCIPGDPNQWHTTPAGDKALDRIDDQEGVGA